MQSDCVVECIRHFFHALSDTQSFPERKSRKVQQRRPAVTFCSNKDAEWPSPPTAATADPNVNHLSLNLVCLLARVSTRTACAGSASTNEIVCPFKSEWKETK
jgi:hypothetical protein